MTEFEQNEIKRCIFCGDPDPDHWFVGWFCSVGREISCQHCLNEQYASKVPGQLPETFLPIPVEDLGLGSPPPKQTVTIMSFSKTTYPLLTSK
jgi:hypothetical protein